MSLSIKCTCGKTWAVSEALVGKRVKCKECGAPVLVGKTSEPNVRKRSARKSADAEDEAFDDADLASEEVGAPVRRQKSRSKASLFDAAELWAVLTNPNPETFSSPYGKGLTGIVAVAFSPVWFAVASLWQQRGGTIVVRKSQAWMWLLGPWAAIPLALFGVAFIAWGIHQLATEPASARKRRNLKAEPLSLKTKLALFSLVPLMCLLAYMYLVDERPQRRVDPSASSDAPAAVPTSTPVAAAPAAAVTSSVASTEKEQPSDPATTDAPTTSAPTDNPPVKSSPVVVTTTIQKEGTTKTAVGVSTARVPTNQLRLIVGFPKELSFGPTFGMTPSGDSVLASSVRLGELLNVVDVKSKKLQAQFPKSNPRGSHHQLVISGDGRKALVAIQDVPARIITCDLTSSKIVGEYQSSLSFLTGIALSHDGTLGCAFDYKRQVEVWETAAGKRLHEAQIKDVLSLLAAQFQQDGSSIVVVTNKNLLRFNVLDATWQVDGKLSFVPMAIKAWPAQTGSAMAIFRRSEIDVIDVATSTLSWSVPSDSGEAILLCAVSGNGRVVATSGTKHVQVWDVTSKTLLAKQPLPSGTSRLVLSSDGTRLLLASISNGLEIWDVPISQE